MLSDIKNKNKKEDKGTSESENTDDNRASSAEKENVDKIDEKLVDFKTPNLLNSMLPYN
jgi:hypothetical protein